MEGNLIKQAIKQLEEAKTNNQKKLVIDIDLVQEYRKYLLFVKNLKSLGYKALQYIRRRLF